jgi:hypothetical protein
MMASSERSHEPLQQLASTVEGMHQALVALLGRMVVLPPSSARAMERITDQSERQCHLR